MSLHKDTIYITPTPHLRASSRSQPRQSQPSLPPLRTSPSPSSTPITTTGHRFSPKQPHGLSSVTSSRFSSPAGSPVVDGHHRGRTFGSGNAFAGPGPSSSRFAGRTTESHQDKRRAGDGSELDRDGLPVIALNSPRARRKGLLVVADRELSGHGHSEEDLHWISEYSPRLEFAEEVILNGYALFAIDKWVVDRQKLVKTVVAFSSEEHAQISTYRLVPRDTLSDEEAEQELEDIAHRLRKDGARPIETSQGDIIMITSLPSLRTDVQTVFIPQGDYQQIKENLYVNINLKRLGCGGRSSLSLDTPSDAVEYKFNSLYRIPKSETRTSFASSVLESIKLLQTGLHLCGLYGLEEGEIQDGLLCDQTAGGMTRWKIQFRKAVEADTGEDKGMGVAEYASSIADLSTKYLTTYGPASVTALFSLITSTKYKLISLSVDKVPRDPFTNVRGFKNALLAYQRYQTSRFPSPKEYLTPSLLDQINIDYSREKQHDATRITRLIKHQVSQAGAGLASNLGALHIGGHHRYDDAGESDESEAEPRHPRHRTPSADGRGSGLMGSPAAPDVITTNIQALVNAVLSASRDRDAFISGRLRGLFTGTISNNTSLSSRNWYGSSPIQPRRPDPDTRELDVVEEELTPDRLPPHRSRNQDRRGTIKTMTSKTGNALRDVAGWARRGSLIPETSDSDSTPQSGVSTADGRGLTSRRMIASMSLTHHEALPHETSRSSLHMRAKSISHNGDLFTDRSSNSARRSATFNVTAPTDQDSLRPSIPSRANTLSFAGSDAYAGGISDYASMMEDEQIRRDSQNTNSSNVADGPPSLSRAGSGSHFDRPRRALYRMVSADCLAEADEDGLEFLHDGHGEEAWEIQQRGKEKTRGILRRRSFSHGSEHHLLEFVHPDYLAVDVAYCSLIDEMRHREREMIDRIAALEKIEKATQEAASTLISEIRSRGTRLAELRYLSDPLQLDPFPLQSSTTSNISKTNPPAPVLPAFPDPYSHSPSQTPQPAQARRQLQQLNLKNDRLSYSLKELDRYVASANRLKGDVGVYVELFLQGKVVESKRSEGSEEGAELGNNVRVVRGGEQLGGENEVGDEGELMAGGGNGKKSSWPWSMWMKRD